MSLLLASVVARVVIQPQALHCTSESCLANSNIREGSAPALTIVVLFSAGEMKGKD